MLHVVGLLYSVAAGGLEVSELHCNLTSKICYSITSFYFFRIPKFDIQNYSNLFGTKTKLIPLCSLKLSLAVIKTEFFLEPPNFFCYKPSI